MLRLRAFVGGGLPAIVVVSVLCRLVVTEVRIAAAEGDVP